MRVSVVVTNYNQSELLWAALHSVAAQTVPPYEIILVDDGSDDRFYCPKWPTLTEIRTPHRGTGAALNTAISVMRGDVFCWLPADDTWKHWKLERQAAFAELHPDCVLHAYADVYHDGKFSHCEEIQHCTDREFGEALRTSSPYFANTFWIPKRVLDTVGPFREDVPASEDYQWVLRSVVQHGVRYRLQPEALTTKHYHANSQTARQHDTAALMAQFNAELGE